MKMISERTEIAKALNFGKYPVLEINLDNVEEYKKNDGTTERYCVGCDVKVEYQTKRYGAMHTHGHIFFDCFDNDNALEHMEISASGSCLKSDFGYSDIMKDLHWANVPTVKAGQEVVVVVRSEKSKMALVILYKVSDRVDPHCMTCATLS